MGAHIGFATHSGLSKLFVLSESGAAVRSGGADITSGEFCMTDRSSLPYRRNVGVALFNREGQVFIGRRRPRAGGEALRQEWQMPQGGIDEGEDPAAAALRELYEETNIRSVEPLGEVPDWLSYDLPEAAIGGGWTRRYRGQTQKWFALRFTGEDSEVDVEKPGGGEFKPEFTTWRWEDLEEVPGLIVAFKRPVYDAVAAEFSRFAAGA